MPSVKAIKEASSPRKKLSTTTRSPAIPKRFSFIMESTACLAMSLLSAIMTPLPAASPSALTTQGAPILSIYFLACPGLLNTLYEALGILCFLRKSLVKALLASSSAAAFDGPKIGSPFSSNISTIPAVRGSSGPTTVRSMDSLSANCSKFSTSPAAISTHVAILLMPALPGAQNILLARDDCLSFQTRACSRPPLPITKIFIIQSPKP